MNYKELKEEILDKTKEYYNKYHVNKKNDNKIKYASRVFDEKEMINLIDASLDFWLTYGKYTEEFEKKFAEFLNVKYCSLVNSGSSANLLAFMSLTSPMLKDRRIKRGDEVITVAVGFPTTISPIIQYGAVPVFVDVTIPEYNIDVSKLEEAYSDKTKAVMIAHTLGIPFDILRVKEFCDKHNLWLIEDNCDALGTKVLIDGEYCYTGSIGDIGTSSFYPPHHMTMGEGGAVYTSNPLLNKIIRSLRDWGRDCVCSSGMDDKCGHRFDKQYGELPLGYDHKYVYSHMGYNLKATDLQAAIGVAQLEKLENFIEKRRYNYSYLLNELNNLEEYFYFFSEKEGTKPSWFGFCITCKSGVDRNKIVKYLEDNGIQTRMLFAGNMIKHPCFMDLCENVDYRISGTLGVTDMIMNNTFWIGVYPGMTQENLDFMIKKIKDYVRNEL